MHFEDLCPVDKSLLDFTVLLHEESLGNAIAIHSKENGLPNLSKTKVAIFGVLDARRSTSSTKSYFSFNPLRKALYQLFPGNWDINIADLGDLRQGHSVDDTYAAVKAIVNSLIKENIIPIILGGGQDLVYAQYRAYDNTEHMVNLVNIDACFDLGNADAEISSRSFVSKIVVNEPYNLFNYANIGYQTFYNAQNEIDLVQKLYFDAVRLGDAAANLKIIEPLLRDANMASIDVSAISNTALQSDKHPYPNGFNGREICAIARYAGLSDKLTSLSICELQDKLEREVSATLIAQLLWYFIEGVTYRKNEHTISAKKEFVKYQVPVEDDILVFYKSPISGRWWIEIPFFSNQNTKLNRRTLLPCSHQDYLDACNQDIPQRWWKARQKNEL